MPLDTVKQLAAQEHKRAGELEHQGKWRHAWRVVGKWANVSIFDVDSPAELHDILNSLPLYPFMEIEVTALCPKRATFRETVADLIGKPEGCRQPADMIAKMVEVVPASEGKFRNVFPPVVEELLKAHQVEMFSRSI